MKRWELSTLVRELAVKKWANITSTEVGSENIVSDTFLDARVANRHENCLPNSLSSSHGALQM